MNTSKITVRVAVQADIRKAWTCWTAPEHIVNWNYASDDWHCPKASNDLRQGGKFNYTMASKDGKMSFDFEGVYDEVVEHQKISYHLADGRQVEVLFTGTGNQTKITETFDPENTNPIEMQRTGWQAILENYKRYVEGL